MRTVPPTMLLTGAAGVLGRALIEELAHDHVLLAARRRKPVADPRVQEIPIDLRRKRLGLSGHDWRELSRRVDLIVHCAAATNWQAPPDEITQTNVAGTENMLELALASGAHLVHVSTAFIHRSSDDGGLAAYLESKRAAERVVSASGIRSAIARPSLIIGDSRDGRIASFQGLHKVMAAVHRGILPVLPASPEATIDFIPQDVAARAIGQLVRRRVGDGVFWLTAGEHALTVAEMLDITLDLAGRNGSRPAPPRLIPTEAVRRLLLPLMDDIAGVGLRRQFRMFCQLLQLFQGRQAMPSSLEQLGLASRMAPAPLKEAFAKSIGYWETVRSGAAAVPV